MFCALTHWGRVTHMCVSKLTIIGSDNGLSPDQRQAIIWTNAWLLLSGPLGTNFSEILIEILTFSFKKMRLKVSSAKRRPFCLGLNALNGYHLHKKCQVSASTRWLWLRMASPVLYRHIPLEVVSDVALSDEWHHRPQQRLLCYTCVICFVYYDVFWLCK